MIAGILSSDTDNEQAVVAIAQPNIAQRNEVPHAPVQQEHDNDSDNKPPLCIRVSLFTIPLVASYIHATFAFDGVELLFGFYTELAALHFCLPLLWTCHNYPLEHDEAVHGYRKLQEDYWPLLLDSTHAATLSVVVLSSTTRTILFYQITA